MSKKQGQRIWEALEVIEGVLDDDPHPDCLKCCGNCKGYQFNEFDRLDCVNEEADLFDDAAELNDICDKWEWAVRSDILRKRMEDEV